MSTDYHLEKFVCSNSGSVDHLTYLLSNYGANVNGSDQLTPVN